MSRGGTKLSRGAGRSNPLLASEAMSRSNVTRITCVSGVTHIKMPTSEAMSHE